MNNTFDPEDPFDDMKDPFSDWNDPFREALDPFGEHPGMNPLPYEAIPPTGFPYGPLDPFQELPGTGNAFLRPGDPPGLPNSAAIPGQHPIPGTELQNGKDKEAEILDQVENSVLHGTKDLSEPELEPEDMLRQVEDSIEGGPEFDDRLQEEIIGSEDDFVSKAAHPHSEEELWPEGVNEKREHSENPAHRRLHGVGKSSPQTDSGTERTYDNQRPASLRKSRGSSGRRRGYPSNGRSRQILKTTRGMKAYKPETRECPAKEEIVSLAECESCQHYKDPNCTWREEEQDKDAGQDQEEVE